MLFFWRHDSGLLHLISGLFAVNGVAAFLAHAFALTTFHNIDSKSMLLAVWLAYCMLFGEFMENLFRMASATGRCARRFRELITSANWLFALCCYYWLSESNSTFGANEYGESIGALGSAVPLVFTALAGLLHSLCGCGRSVAMSERTYRRARCRFLFGLLCATIGATLWIATENLCDRTDGIGYSARWFPGHLVWHASCAYGLCNALLFAGALRADNFRTKVYISYGRGGVAGLYFSVLPRMMFDGAGGIVQPEEESVVDAELGRGATMGSSTVARIRDGIEDGMRKVSPRRKNGSAATKMNRIAVEPIEVDDLSPPPSPAQTTRSEREV